MFHQHGRVLLAQDLLKARVQGVTGSFIYGIVALLCRLDNLGNTVETGCDIAPVAGVSFERSRRYAES